MTFVCPTVATAEAFSPESCESLYSTNLVDEMAHQIDSRITDSDDPSADMRLFLNRGEGAVGWVRNPNAWTQEGTTALDLSGVSPWNSDGEYRKSGTLISPKHIVFAHHFQMPNGTTVVFVSPTGEVFERVIVNQVVVPNSADIHLAVLNEDLPDSIAFYPVISTEHVATHFRSASGMPVVALDQEGKVIVRDVYYHVGISVNHRLSLTPPRSLFSEALETGDSGAPGFFVVGDQLILGFTHTGRYNGPAHGNFIEQINTAMAGLGGSDYQVSTYDLSCFDSGRIRLAPQNFLIEARLLPKKFVGKIVSTGLFPEHSKVHRIVSGNVGGTFHLNPDTGVLSVLRLNRNNTTIEKDFNLVVEVRSFEFFLNSATTTVTVKVR